MFKLLSNRACWISCALVLLAGAVVPAQSRPWSRNPTTLAQDYAVINDNRGHGDIVMVMWLAPPIAEKGPTTQVARDLLDKCVVIGVVHAHVANDGNFAFDQVTDIQAADGRDQPLNSLNVNTMPPSVVGVLAAVQSLFARSMGALGQGIHWFAFDSGSVNACTKGGLAVSFAGEKYTYDTPFPGCP